MILFKPQPAAHPFQASIGAAKAERTVGSDIEVADFTGVGIRSAMERAVGEDDTAPNAGRDSHIEQREVPAPGAV